MNLIDGDFIKLLDDTLDKSCPRRREVSGYPLGVFHASLIRYPESCNHIRPSRAVSLLAEN